MAAHAVADDARDCLFRLPSTFHHAVSLELWHPMQQHHRSSSSSPHSSLLLVHRNYEHQKHSSSPVLRQQSSYVVQSSSSSQLQPSQQHVASSCASTGTTDSPPRHQHHCLFLHVPSHCHESPYAAVPAAYGSACNHAYTHSHPPPHHHQTSTASLSGHVHARSQPALPPPSFVSVSAHFLASPPPPLVSFYFRNSFSSMTFLTLHAVHTRTHAYTYIIPPLSSLSLLVSRSHHNLHRHTKTRAAAQNPAPRDEVFKIQQQEMRYSKSSNKR